MFIVLAGIFFATVLDFAALHDIYNDYLSKRVLESLEFGGVNEVPAWTETPGEWSLLKFSLTFKLFAILALLVLTFGMLKNEGDRGHT